MSGDPRRPDPRRTKSRSNRCGPCPLRMSGGGAPGTLSCKSGKRLCERFDVSLVELFPGRRIRDYLQLQQLIDAGYSLAQQQLARAAPEIATEDHFLDFTRHLHGTIFGGAFGSFAGRFRDASDPDAEVGHEGHKFEGAPWPEIEPRMRALARQLPIARAPQDRDQFCRWAARFCQEYFAIHPFRDGNGRTSRFIVEVAARGTGRLEYMPPTFTSRGAKTADRDDYIYSLQYAHRQCGVSRASGYLGSSSRDPFKGLTRWWRRRIHETTPDALDEIPPDVYELLLQLDAANPGSVDDYAYQIDDPWEDYEWLAQVAAENERAREEEERAKELSQAALDMILTPPQRRAPSPADDR